jgi:hypothetical protein
VFKFRCKKTGNTISEYLDDKFRCCIRQPQARALSPGRSPALPGRSTCSGRATRSMHGRPSVPGRRSYTQIQRVGQMLCRAVLCRVTNQGVMIS